MTIEILKLGGPDGCAKMRNYSSDPGVKSKGTSSLPLRDQSFGGPRRFRNSRGFAISNSLGGGGECRMTSGARGRVHGGAGIWGFLVVLGEPQFSYFLVAQPLRGA